MESNLSLPKVVARRAKRLGRGPGSGKGRHTAGRGQKGQKARTKIHILFEGYKGRKSLLHRLPMLRGKGKMKIGEKPIVVNLSDLEKLPAGAKIDIETLVKHNLVKEREAKKYGVKILGKGKTAKKFDILLPMSAKAANALSKADNKKTK